MVRAEDTVNGFLASIGFVAKNGVLQRELKPTMRLDVMNGSLDAFIYNYSDASKLKIEGPVVVRLELFGQQMPDFQEELSCRLGVALEERGCLYVARFPGQKSDFAEMLGIALKELRRDYNGSFNLISKSQ